MADDTLDRLCGRFDLDPAAAREVAQAAARGSLPWYLHVMIGIGAWLAAAALIGTILQFVLLIADGDGMPLLAAGFGAVAVAVAVILHQRADGAFAHQFAVATALAGQTLMAGGLGLESESLAIAAAAALAGAATLLVLVRDPPLQFLASGLTLALVQAALLEQGVPQSAGILAAPALAGALALLVRPPAALDLRGLAYALLLTPIAVLSVFGVAGLETDGLARAVYAAGLLVVLGLVWRDTRPEARPTAIAAGAVAITLGAVTAAGMLAALVLLVLAYALGNRMLAALGVVAQIWFVSRFYDDLDLTLLAKSGMLLAAGSLLLALWWVWIRRPAPEAGHDA